MDNFKVLLIITGIEQRECKTKWIWTFWEISGETSKNCFRI